MEHTSSRLVLATDAEAASINAAVHMARIAEANAAYKEYLRGASAHDALMKARIAEANAAYEEYLVVTSVHDAVVKARTKANSAFDQVLDVIQLRSEQSYTIAGRLHAKNVLVNAGTILARLSATLKQVGTNLAATTDTHVNVQPTQQCKCAVEQATQSLTQAATPETECICWNTRCTCTETIAPLAKFCQCCGMAYNNSMTQCHDGTVRCSADNFDECAERRECFMTLNHCDHCNCGHGQPKRYINTRSLICKEGCRTLGLSPNGPPAV
jgi:hypothetical protein